ncbi:polyprotein, partial [Cordyline virus 2]
THTLPELCRIPEAKVYNGRSFSFYANSFCWVKAFAAQNKKIPTGLSFMPLVRVAVLLSFGLAPSFLRHVTRTGNNLLHFDGTYNNNKHIDVYKYFVGATTFNNTGNDEGENYDIIVDEMMKKVFDKCAAKSDNVTLSNVLGRCSQKMNKWFDRVPNIKVNVCLNSKQKRHMSELFPDLKIEYIDHGYSSHALFTAVREASNYVLFPKVGFRNFIDFGGNVFTHSLANNSDIHICAPCVDVRDAKRHTDVALSLERSLGLFDQINVCTNKAQDCCVIKDRAIAVEVYDMTLNDMADAMIAHGCKKLSFSLLLPGELLDDFDEIRLFDNTCKIVRNANVVSYFYGSSAESYDHNLNDLREIMTNQVVVRKGKIFKKTLEKSRGPFRFYSLVLCSTMPSGLHELKTIYDCSQSSKVTVRVPVSDINGRITQHDIMIDKSFVVNMVEYAANCVDNFNRKGFEYIMSHYRSRKSYVIYNGQVINEAVNIAKNLPGLLAVMLSEGLRTAERTNFLARMVYYQYYAPSLLRCIIQGLTNLFFGFKSYCYQSSISILKILFGDWIVKAYENSGSQIRYINESIEVTQVIRISTSGDYVDILDTTFQKSVKACGDMAEFFSRYDEEYDSSSDTISEAVNAGGGKPSNGLSKGEKFLKSPCLKMIYLRLCDLLCSKLKIFSYCSLNNLKKILDPSQNLLSFIKTLIETNLNDLSLSPVSEVNNFISGCLLNVKTGIILGLKYIFNEIISKGFDWFRKILLQAYQHLKSLMIRVGTRFCLSYIDPLIDNDEIAIFENIKSESQSMSHCDRELMLEGSPLGNGCDGFDDITHILQDLDDLICSGGGFAGISFSKIIIKSLEKLKCIVIQSLSKSLTFAKLILTKVRQAICSLKTFVASGAHSLPTLKNFFKNEEELDYILVDSSDEDESIDDSTTYFTPDEESKEELLEKFLFNSTSKRDDSYALRLLRRVLTFSEKYLPSCFTRILDEIISVVEVNLSILAFEKTFMNKQMNRENSRIRRCLSHLRNAVKFFLLTGNLGFQTLYTVLNKLLSSMVNKVRLFLYRPEVKQILFENIFETAVVYTSALALSLFGLSFSVTKLALIPPVYLISKKAFKYYFKTEEPLIPMVYTTLMGANLPVSLASTAISTASVMISTAKLITYCENSNLCKTQLREVVAKHTIYSHARFIESVFSNRWFALIFISLIHLIVRSANLTMAIIVLCFASKFYGKFIIYSANVANLSIALNQDIRDLNLTGNLRKKIYEFSKRKFKTSNITTDKNDVNIQSEGFMADCPENLKTDEKVGVKQPVRHSVIIEELGDNENVRQDSTYTFGSSSQVNNQLYNKNKLVNFEAKMIPTNKSRVCKELLAYPDKNHFTFIQTSHDLVNSLREYIYLERTTLLNNIRKIERAADFYRSGVKRVKDLEIILDDRSIYTYNGVGDWVSLSTKTKRSISDVRFYITPESEIRDSKDLMSYGCFTTDDLAAGYTNNRLIALDAEDVENSFIDYDILNKVVLTNKPPGSGKTTAVVDKIIEDISHGGHVLALSVTNVGKEEILSKLKQRGVSRSGLVMTVDGFIMSNMKYRVNTLLIDECFMTHCGSIIHIFKNIIFDKCFLYGDVNQIPYICRLPHTVVNFSQVVFDRVNKEYDCFTYRCPLDVCYILSNLTNEIGEKIYKKGVFSKKNLTLRSLDVVGINTFEEIPFKKGDIVMTFTQAEKNEISKFNNTLTVKTVNEIQGATYSKVKLVRTKVYANEIYDDINQIVTAISRHTDMLVYYTPYACLNDKVSSIIKDTNNVEDYAISQFGFKQRV